MDFRKGLRLLVLHARPADIVDRITRLVIDPVFDAGAIAPDLILIDQLFSNQAADVERLDELAQHAASLPSVVLAGLGSEFFGVKHSWQVASLPAFVSFFDQWQFAKWRTLREQRHAHFLGVVFGRCLLRAPWDDTVGDGSAFRFRERCQTEKDFIWCSGVIAAGCNIARSVAAAGWPTRLVGRVEGFATAPGGTRGEKQFGPADLQMPLDKAQELGVGGINVVVSAPGGIEVLLCNGLSAARPARVDAGALLEVSLPYQLFASRLSSLLLDLKPHLIELPERELAVVVLQHLRTWLGIPETGAGEQQALVQARTNPEEPGSLQLVVTVTPPEQLLPGGVPVVLGYRLR
jgi:hypothetical protein